MFAPTQPDVQSEHGLASGGLLIPWTTWRAGEVEVRSEVCEVSRTTPKGEAQIVGSRVKLTNSGGGERTITLYAAVTAKGAAGAPIDRLGVRGDAIFVNDQPALLSNEKPDAGLAPAPEENARLDELRRLPPNPQIRSQNRIGSGAFRFDVTLAAGESKTFGFVSPVLHGRRAARHIWDGVGKWAQLDQADPIIGSQGVEQPSPGVEFYRAIRADDLFDDAQADWRRLVGKVTIDVPDKRWAEAFAAITGHAAMSMNEGAPDVAVVNYNVFNRDGVYVANILQKAGNFDLAREAIDYFLRHPFNGRVEPEADNPGEVLWILGEHWLFTRDREWLERVYPAAKKLAAMIEYCRTTPEPHWVSATSLDFGDALPADQRQKLVPGSCDGFQPRYTEAWDIAGLRAAATLAEAMKSDAERDAWRALLGKLAMTYDEKFGVDLAKDYGSYAVLWPCRVYPLGSGRGFETFRRVGAQKPESWRYFPLAKAHQGLLAGNRVAAAETLAIHLDHEQMRGWYALDEGGPSGPGNWGRVVSNWKVTRQGAGGAESAMAMPHGWAIAEFELLLRDALAFEDEGKLVLFAGVPEGWFAQPMRLRNLPTHFGTLSVEWKPNERGGTLVLSGDAKPPGGFVFRGPRGDTLVRDVSKPFEIEAR